jgi:hypothetical protein
MAGDQVKITSLTVMARLVRATQEHERRKQAIDRSCSWVPGIPRFALQPGMTVKMLCARSPPQITGGILHGRRRRRQ